MKKALTIASLFLTFLIIYFLQANFFNWFTIAGIKPNMFVILVLFVSLFTKMEYGIGFGIFIGFILDVIIGQKIGATSILLGIVAVLGGIFDKNFSKDSRITLILMVTSSTAVFEIGNYIFSAIQLSINIEPLQFIRVLIIEIIYNIFITIIIYPLIQKVGYLIEDIFKGQKILTRYF